MEDKEKYHPLFQGREYLSAHEISGAINFVSIDTNESAAYDLLTAVANDHHAVLCLYSTHAHPMLSVRRYIMELMTRGIECPLILAVESHGQGIDEQLIHFSTEAGALFLDGMGDGIWLINDEASIPNSKVSGRTYLEAKNNQQFINNTSFSILQATRNRISKTEYISCPSCGRTLFDLQETTAKIRAVTNHLKGVKIAIMGCIVNGPGEMADADFGYVGSGPGKITLYKGKEVVKRNVNSDIAVEELIGLIRESDEWVEP
jgi:(E)-4-hydroxy-3-methylbut-2-enyl-diphosphate synthase